MGRIIEGFWDCPYCGEKHISGLKQECPVCGKARDSSTKFYMDGSRNVVSGETEKKKRLGPDWLCTYCNSYNPAYEPKCLNCGHGRDEEDPDYFSVPKEDDEPPDEPHFQPPPVDEHSVEREPLRNRNPRSSFPVSNPNTYSWGSLAGKLGIVAIIGVVIALLAFLFTPKNVELTVENLTWDYSINIEELLTFDESDWSLPAGARLQRSSEELYGYEQVLDHYETKTREVSEQVLDGYDEIVTGYRDLGNGTFEEMTSSVPRYRTEYRTETYQEPVYRDEPIYRTKYYYEIDRWTVTRSVDTSGNDKEPYWGEVVLAYGEREGSRTTKYTLFTLNEDNESKKYNVTEAEWEAMNIGDTIQAKVNNIGSFELLLPN